MDDNMAMVIFQPSGRRGEVPKGISIIEASRKLGVDIEALCGEKKVCGKCIVRIEEGRFEKYGIDSAMSHVSGWQEEEAKFINPDKRKQGLRLGVRGQGGRRYSGVHPGGIPGRKTGGQQESQGHCDYP